MNAADCTFEETQLLSPGARLHRRICRPAAEPWARLLIIHGYGEHAGRYDRFMRWMAGVGIVCESLDLRGHGRSTGRRGFIQKWDEFLDDVQAFLDVPHEISPPTFVLGHSHGGLITVAAGERGILAEAGVSGCILCSPYLTSGTRPAKWKLVLARGANRLVPWLRVGSGLRSEWLSEDAEMIAEDRADPFMNRSATPRWYFTMLQTQAMVRKKAARFTLPMLCLTGERDIVADPKATAIFFDQAKSSDKSLYTYPQRVHELLRDMEREKVFADITGWIAARRVPLENRSASQARISNRIL